MAGSSSFPDRMVSLGGLSLCASSDVSACAGTEILTTSSMDRRSPGRQRAADPVEWMRKLILSGNLRIQAFSNGKGVWVPKRLAMNVKRGVLGIQDDRPGMKPLLYKISEIERITKTAPLECPSPPPTELLAALHFKNDMMLCFLFESAEVCQLAITVINRLCGVPIRRQTSRVASSVVSSSAA